MLFHFDWLVLGLLVKDGPLIAWSACVRHVQRQCVAFGECVQCVRVAALPHAARQCLVVVFV